VIRPFGTLRGGLEDCVERRTRFETDHPDISIVSPGKGPGRWLAIGPPGWIPGDELGTTLGTRDLCEMMAKLDEIFPPDELAQGPPRC
jgi:hypothetical protein